MDPSPHSSPTSTLRLKLGVSIPRALLSHLLCSPYPVVFPPRSSLMKESLSPPHRPQVCLWRVHLSPSSWSTAPSTLPSPVPTSCAPLSNGSSGTLFSCSLQSHQEQGSGTGPSKKGSEGTDGQQVSREWPSAAFLLDRSQPLSFLWPP